MKASIAILAAGAIGAAAGAWWYDRSSGAAARGVDVADATFVERGQVLYARECASCHGPSLQGQTPNWRSRLPDGSIPAPPHDETGHTWHHPDRQLFELTKYGRYKASGGRVSSNMPGFENKLSDEEIWSVLSFIQSRWPDSVQRRHDTINQRAEGRR